MLTANRISPLLIVVYILVLLHLPAESQESGGYLSAVAKEITYSDSLSPSFQETMSDSLNKIALIQTLEQQKAEAIDEQKSLKKKLNQAKTLRWLFMWLGGAFLVLLVFFFRRYRLNWHLNRELKRKEKELSNAMKRIEENQERFFHQHEKVKQMIDSSSDGLWEVNLETEEISFGNSFERLSGSKAETFTVKEITQPGSFFHPEDAPIFQQAIKDCMAGRRKEVNVELRIKQKAKSYRWIRLRGCRIVEQTSKKQEWIMGIVYDIHSLKEAQTRMREKEQELLEANKAKDKFFSIIAHDLKSPFNAIVGLSDLLNQEYYSFTDEEKKEFIDSIYQASENAFQLLQNLLQWSRSQNNRIEFYPETIDFNKLVDEVIQVNQHRAAQKEITIHKEHIENITLEADKNMLNLVIHNLLSNALKFTSRGKRVTLKAYVKQQHLWFYVIDMGIGIPEEQQATLFNIDNNYKKHGTEKETGTGLGLILCKEFITSHQGQIWVESKENEGSTFGFKIPVNQS
ncbi:MAG TPA: PAS domain-containing sensor histidine kinase [Bacteroidales bacterium]|nr:PAS domain-containing sensor histidine kinase [Bacteroidales bacterium]